MESTARKPFAMTHRGIKCRAGWVPLFPASPRGTKRERGERQQVGAPRTTWCPVLQSLPRGSRASLAAYEANKPVGVKPRGRCRFQTMVTTRAAGELLFRWETFEPRTSMLPGTRSGRLDRQLPENHPPAQPSYLPLVAEVPGAVPGTGTTTLPVPGSALVRDRVHLRIICPRHIIIS